MSGIKHLAIKMSTFYNGFKSSTKKGEAMKRIICLVLLFVLIATPAYAADLDVTSLSDDDLKALQTKVVEEMTNRGLEISAIIDPGHYVIGTDMRAGRYVFSPSSDAEDYWGCIGLYNNIEDCRNLENCLDETYVMPDNSPSMTLEDGQAINVLTAVRATFCPALPFAP